MMQRVVAWSGGALQTRLFFCLALGCLGLPNIGCKSAGSDAVRKTSPRVTWPAEAVFQGYPVIHCSRDDIPSAYVRDMGKNGQSEAVARESYTTTRELVLTTLNLFLATGRWAGERAQISATRDPPRPGAPNECRMFELALADEITLRLPPSVSGAPYIAPIAMVGYDYEPAENAKSAAHISVRIAALLARGNGQVLRTLAVVARSPVAQIAPHFQERPSQEIAQDLTEQLAKKLAQALAE
ncbi:MAG: hypothetical protein JNJ46_05465 [Myxococcales bacterium]|nr:hypothetical protein [Myxococcales bacterium]